MCYPLIGWLLYTNILNIYALIGIGNVCAFRMLYYFEPVLPSRLWSRGKTLSGVRSGHLGPPLGCLHIFHQSLYHIWCHLGSSAAGFGKTRRSHTHRSHIYIHSAPSVVLSPIATGTCVIVVRCSHAHVLVTWIILYYSSMQLIFWHLRIAVL